MTVSRGGESNEKESAPERTRQTKKTAQVERGPVSHGLELLLMSRNANK
jgi:hypothetical protein